MMRTSNVRFPKVLLALLIVLLLISVAAQYTIAHNQIYTSYKGFAVDSHGNLYLGVKSRIIAVDTNGLERYSFSTVTTRGYSFTINEEDQILLRSGEYLYTMDLHGNVLKKDVGTEKANRVLPYSKSTRSFRDSNGCVYQMSRRFFREEIYKYDHGEASLIYQMPLLSYVLMLVSEGSALCNVILVPTFLWKIWKINGEKFRYKES